MKPLAVLRTSLAALRCRRVPTMLGTAGVVCGTAALVVLIAIGEGTRREALEQLDALGARNILIRAVAGRGDSPRGISGRELENLARTVPGVRLVSPARELPSPPVADSAGTGFEALAVTPAYRVVRGLTLTSGRFFGDLDVSRRARVCVLGSAVAQALGAGGRQGALVRWGGEAYTVVGVLSPRGRGGARTAPITVRDPDRLFLVPLGGEMPGDSAVEEATIEMERMAQVPAAATAVRRLLASRPGGPARLQVIVPLELVQEASRARRSFTLALAGIAAVSLLVGAVGIVNVMIAIVTERRREIGIRRAVGADRRDIAAQFLVESMVLALAGGVTGILIGMGAAVGVLPAFGWAAVVTGWSLALAAAMALVVGGAAGIYPAWRAAALDPVEAITAS